MPEAADADDDRDRVARQPRPTSLDGVASGHAGIGQRRRIDRIDIPELHEVACRNHDLLGHAAVAGDAWNRGRGLAAQVVLASPARRATAAPDELVDSDGGSDRRRPYRGAQLDDLAHDLVPERDRRLRPTGA